MSYSPLEYIEASILAREAGMEMLARLDWMSIAPKMIVDMGCGAGEMSAHLRLRYKEAKVIALDISETMINHVHQQYREEADLSGVCADANRLPFYDSTVDLIFANLLLPWCNDLVPLLQEWRRVLRPNGLLIFTFLGLDTLKEGLEIGEVQELPQFIDMHDMGDLLLQGKFADPVLDVNYYTLVYQDKEKLVSELYKSGMIAKPLALQHKNSIMPFTKGPWRITYELVYAHAFIPAEQTIDDEVRIPLARMRQQLGIKK